MKQPWAKKVFNGPFIALLALFVIFSIFVNRFFHVNNLTNIFRQAIVLSFVSLGQMVSILLKGINLSVGSVMGLSSVVTGLVLVNGVPLIPGVAIGLLVGLAAGLISGYLIAYTEMPAFISTFGMRGIAMGAALVLSNESVIWGFTENLRLIHDGAILGIPAPFWALLVVYALFYLMLKYTSFGTGIYAIGGNEDAAVLSGVKVRLLKMWGYGLGGLMAAVGGVMMTARVNSAQAIHGVGFEFDSIAAVVLGGTMLGGGKGGVIQTLIGVFIIATLRNGMNLIGISVYFQLVFIGLIIIVAYMIDGIKEYFNTLIRSHQKREGKVG